MPDDGIWIESTRGPDDKPVCLITWGSMQWYAPVADVRVTALDLLTCAAYAEMAMHLKLALDLDAGTASALMSDLLSQQRSEEFGTLSTITLMPAGSTKRRLAVVLLRRVRGGSGWDGEVDAAEARAMALRWLEVAEATESDQLVSEALRATRVCGTAGQEKLFGYLRELRAAP
jgi:hypothetical protein